MLYSMTIFKPNHTGQWVGDLLSISRDIEIYLHHLIIHMELKILCRLGEIELGLTLEAFFLTGSHNI